MSTKANKIKVLDKEYAYKFGMRFQKYFMENLGVKTNAEYDKKLGLIFNNDVPKNKQNDKKATEAAIAKKLTNPKGNPMELVEMLEVFAWFIISAIQSHAKEKIDFDVYDVCDYIQVEGFEGYSVLFADFAAHQVKVFEANPNALGKSKK